MSVCLCSMMGACTDSSSSECIYPGTAMIPPWPYSSCFFRLAWLHDPPNNQRHCLSVLGIDNISGFFFELQTVVCFPYLRGVIELGATEMVIFVLDLALI